MSATRNAIFILNQKLFFLGIMFIFSVGSTWIAQAQQADDFGASAMILEAVGGDGGPSLEELRDHAATINEILDVAGERVERLAADGATSPEMLSAIRQELSLSRRWNSHLATILLDVAEARRALGERERQAALEIIRMSALAEQARLELLALKDVLGRSAEDREGASDERSDGNLDVERSGEPAGRGDLGQLGMRDMQERLMSMQAMQASAIRDVDAVRGKIIDALQTLSGVRGSAPAQDQEPGESLSSNDITAWAASMAGKLNPHSGKASD